MGWRKWAAAVITLLLAAACTTAETPAARPTETAVAVELEPSEPFGVTAVTLRNPDTTKGVEVPVYDAFTPETRARGLMGRKQLPDRAGMVFRFPDNHRGGFWMKNTLIPLSIAFFDAGGVVVRVLDMPPCDADPCPSYDPKLPYRGALEVNRGFFADMGLTAGWRVELPPGLPAAS